MAYISKRMTRPLLSYLCHCFYILMIMKFQICLALHRKPTNRVKFNWGIADLPNKYRSALHVIQLAAQCKVADSAVSEKCVKKHSVPFYKTYALLNNMVYSLSALVSQSGAHFYVLCLIICLALCSLCAVFQSSIYL